MDLGEPTQKRWSPSGPDILSGRHICAQERRECGQRHLVLGGYATVRVYPQGTQRS